MPKVTEAHREARRDQIIDAAISCFIRNGIHVTTMADVIAESGLSSGAIYAYFNSKQELALAAVRREAAGRSSTIDEAGRTGPLSPAGLLRILHDEFILRPRTGSIVVQLWSEAATDAAFAQVATGAFAALSGSLLAPLTRWAEARNGLDATASAAWAERTLPVMLSLLQGLVLQQTIVPGFDRELYLARVEELFA